MIQRNNQQRHSQQPGHGRLPTLMAQEPLFCVETTRAREPAHLAARRHHPVAGDDDRDRIGRTGRTHGPHRPGACPCRAAEIAIGIDLARRYTPHGGQYLPPKRRHRRVNGQIIKGGDITVKIPR